VVAKKAAVATVVQQLHLVLQLPQRSAQQQLRLPRAASMTWTTTFRSDQ